MTRRQRRRAARAFERVREQLRLALTTVAAAGEVIREQRAIHHADLDRMADLVCQLLEAEQVNEELGSSLARMTGRYAEALQDAERLRALLAAEDVPLDADADVSDEAWAEFDAQAVGP